MAFVNIEIKARCHNQAKIRRILRSENAEFLGKGYQIDTYFKLTHGRLKLREGKIENYLIYYDREDKKGPKRSNVILFKTKPISPLKRLLSEALGVLVIVEKQRETYLFENIKFHIDRVRNLGTFIEIEAMGREDTLREEDLLNQCKIFLDLFKISKENLVSASYSDLLLKRK
jgi:predicted adenylyl cyclase CyaB